MKVIDLYQNQQELIDLALKKDRQAQKVIYNKYAPKLLSICRQYISDIYLAEDVLVSSFMKIFSKLHLFENRGNFEGWMRRIVVNESISFLRANKKVNFEIDEETLNLPSTENTDLAANLNDIQAMIDELPPSSKMVFVLYAVEGYKHYEIANMLNINEGTSKSQLAYARKLLQQQINNQNLKENQWKSIQ